MFEVNAKELVNKLDVVGGARQLTECDALMEYVERCVRLMNEEIASFDDKKREKWTAENGRADMKLNHQVSGAVAAMRVLEQIPAHKGALLELRKDAYQAKEKTEKFNKAEESLIEAAQLLGLPDDFYIRIQRIELPSQGYEEIALRTVAPIVEGEYRDQHAIREELANWHKHSWEKQLNKAIIEAIDKLDTKRGGGSKTVDTKALVIKLLWGVWVEELKITEGVTWKPALVASKILAFCGHEVKSARINTYAGAERDNAREKLRLLQKYPESTR